MAQKTGGNIMFFTEENKKRWLPELKEPGTHDEYLENLGLINKGEDFGAIMSYDPALAEKYEARMKLNAQGN